MNDEKLVDDKLFCHILMLVSKWEKLFCKGIMLLVLGRKCLILQGMKCSIKIFFCVIVALMAASCDRFEYHPYSVGISGDRDLNTATVARLEAAGLKPPFKFAFISDTQGSYDETSEALDIMAARGDIDFIIHGGDQSDFGLPMEFVWCRDMFLSYEIPFLTVIGNHDCVGNGEDTFSYIYGPDNFSLNVGPLHLVVLNTVALEYDYSHPVPDFDFIERDRMLVDSINTVHPDSLTHTVIAMHSRPYDEQFNNNVARPFNHYIEQYPGMGVTGDGRRSFCVNGHNHFFDIVDIFDNGIPYYQSANAAKRMFFVFTITDESYEYEVVEY